MRITNYLNNTIKQLLLEYNNLDRIISEIKYSLSLINIDLYQLEVDGKYIYLMIEGYNISLNYEIPLLVIREHEIKNILQ